MHTTASDGENTIFEMAQAAQELGYKYIAITDHSKSLRIAHGLSEQQLWEHINEIDKVNSKLAGMTVLKSAEVDILEDGRLDYPDELLSELDLTVCSIHSKFQVDREKQTARVLKAMDSPFFNILGHATGRLLLSRDGYDIDLEKIIRHAKDVNCFLEINSSPNRLDLNDEYAQMAKCLGVKIAINTDAHAVRELNLIEWGILQGRRGWLTRDDVLNWSKLRKSLRRH